MDNNKLKVLQELPYVIQRCCGLCKFGTFPGLGSNWGTCKENSYEHQKHSDANRQLSINKFGSCPKFEADSYQVTSLAKFAGFGP